MALRFLADHCISNFIVQTLRNAKHEVFRLRISCRLTRRMLSSLQKLRKSTLYCCP